jgi:biotin-dependent carboxylase-like uncharacterized protein
MNAQEVLQILSPGPGATLQDRGRPGWRRFGVPPGGAMDEHAAGWANRLLDNSPEAPVLELLVPGPKLAVLNDVWLAVTGATSLPSGPGPWRAVRFAAGRQLEFGPVRSGLWVYVAVEGGFVSERWLGSASAYPRAGLGSILRAGDLLSRGVAKPFQLPSGVSGRVVPPFEQRSYDANPALRVWPGPQAEQFSEVDRECFFAKPWKLSAQSDRVGYRLEGEPLRSHPAPLLSEAVRVGTVQVPDNGLPIVTMRDGPTVGGYPKIGVLDSADVSRLAQCRPGQTIQFQPANENGPELRSR